jgi:hypothetical protein
MRKFLVVILLFIGVTSLQAQYWFGPKFGLHLADHDYLSSTYAQDSFKVNPNLNFTVGATFTYTANKRYSVFTELAYERIGRKVSNRDGITAPSSTNIETGLPNYSFVSRSTYHYLSVPFMLRVNFAIPSTRVGFYVGGGTKISYWLGGNGLVSLQEFDEFTIEDIEYRIVFRQSRSDGVEKLAFTDANRIQYSLQLGAGFNVDLPNESQVNLDFRFTYGHSNMGFNGSPDFEWVGYYENYEFRHHLLAVSVGYILQYNAQLARKGKSTIKDSNRR